ncbi:MAG: hypothetical protein HOP13_06735 [Alphaproteobacteria bacterium]|nr:hypothetical protein [Alphaproteobacteria bacterium]
MKVTSSLATAVTTAALSLCASSIAGAGDQYAFPSQSGVQLGASPAPAFVASASAQAGHTGITVGNTFVYAPALNRYEPPLPPPNFAYGTSGAAPYAGRLMSHALMVAPYANYAADYARLFAPNHAVSAWTERVFGVIDGGYTAVDGWTAAAYGMPRVAGPRRRGESSPDLSLMPSFRAHPELDRGPATFRNQGN